MKNIILKHLNDLGTELEESYGDKLIVLEEKDFNEFTETLVKKLTVIRSSSQLPTEKEWFEIRNKLAEEHIERLSKQSNYFILRAGIEKGMDAIIDRFKAIV